MADDEGLGSAQVTIRAMLDKLEKDLDEAKGKVNKGMTRAWEKIGPGLAKIGGAAVKAGLAGVVTGVTAIGGAALASWKSFDDATDGIIQKTGASGAALEALQSDAQAIFKSIPVDIEAAADVVGTLNQRLGVTGETAQELGKRLLMMGTADVAQSTELYTRVMGDWSIKNEDAAATLDKLYKTSQLTGIGVDSLMSKVVQFGSPLRLMGFSLEESAAMFGKWEKEGVNAELVMGSLRIAAGKFAEENAKANTTQVGGVKSMTEAQKKLDDLKEKLAIATQRQSEFNDKTKASSRMQMDKTIRNYTSEIASLEAAMAKGEFRTVKTEGANKSLGDSLRETITKIQTMENASEALNLGMEIFGARAGPDMVAAIREGRFEIDDLVKAMEGSEGAILDTANATMDFPEKLKLMKNRVQTALKPVGDVIANTLGGLADKAGPMVEKFVPIIEEKLLPVVQKIGDALGRVMEGDLQGGLATLFGEDTATQIQAVMDKIGGFIEKMGGLEPVLKAVGVVVGVVLVAAFIAWAAAAWAAVAPLLPIYAAVGAIIGVVALAVAAWENDWGGIRTWMTSFWEGTLKPIFTQLVTWFQTNIPIAIQKVSDFWTGTLQPAIKVVGDWISGTLVPILQQIWDWLATNIPAAITTVTGFWNDTLLPALQGVWAWIDTNLIPLFESVGNVLDAVVGVAVTALAGLWENVLLPAVQSVGNWFNDTLVPALQSAADTINDALGVALEWLSGLWNDTLLPAIQTVSDWFTANITPALEAAGDTINETLGPAIEWVTGLFDKAKGGLEGISGVITKVTGFFDKLAEKVRNFKLPDVLTPGSPTPFEQGLVGVGDALVMVTDRFFAFATAVSPERAKAMKDVGSSLKDLAKAIGEVVGSMMTLNATQGPGNAVDIGAKFEAYLLQFEQIGTAALEKVQQIWDEFGYKRIHKLKLTAGRIREIIEGVMIDLSGVTERKLPPLDVWFQQLRDVFAYSADMVASAIAEFGAKKLADMAQAAANVSAMYQVIWSGLADIKVNTDPEWRTAFVLLMDQLTFLGGLIVGWLGGFEQSVRNMIANAAEVATNVKELWGVFFDLNSIKPYTGEGTFDSAIVYYVDQLSLALMFVSGWLGNLSAEAVELVKKAAEAAKPVVEIFAILGIDLSKLIPAPPNFAALFGGFLATVAAAAVLMKPALAQIRQEWGIDLLKEAAETAGLLKTVIDVLGLGQVFADLGKPENAIGKNVGGLIQRLLAALGTATALLVPGLTTIQDQWGAALEKVKGIAALIKEVIGNSSEAYKSAVEFTSGGGLNLSAFSARIAQLNQAAALATAGLSAPSPTAPNGGGQGGADSATARERYVFNFYLPDGSLGGTFTDDVNEAGETDIYLGVAMGAA